MELVEYQDRLYVTVSFFRADSIYEEMKQRYGTQGCYLLKINSRVSNRGTDEQIPDPWSQYLQKNSIQNQVLQCFKNNLLSAYKCPWDCFFW